MQKKTELVFQGKEEDAEAGLDSLEIDSLNGESRAIMGRDRTVQQATLFTNCVVFAAIIAGFIITISIISATLEKVNAQGDYPTTVTTVYSSLGLPGHEGDSWDDVLAKVDGTKVNFWMYSGSPTINNWVDNWLAPKCRSQYGIILNRVPEGAPTAVNQMILEKNDGNYTGGDVDLVWINGVNYDNARTAGVLYGPFANKVPASVNFDFYSEDIAIDFGKSTNGYEMPYNMAQVAFIYNTDKLPNGAPQTIGELVTWIKGAGVGKFTYPMADSDFTGSAFIRHFLYYYPEGQPYEEMFGDFNQGIYDSRAPAAFAKLQDISPYLYQKNGATYYPATIVESDALFANGEIWLTLNYDSKHAGKQVAAGAWPTTSKGYVLSSGTLSNTNFVAVGKYAKNVLGGVVVANKIGEIASQFSRAQREGIGALQPYDETSPNLVSGGWSVAFDYLATKLYPQNPSEASLQKYELPELVPKYETTLQSDWVNNVYNYKYIPL
jgi:putative spermidine/putrescine transport system substrate-binding protein